MRTLIALTTLLALVACTPPDIATEPAPRDDDAERPPPIDQTDEPDEPVVNGGDEPADSPQPVAHAGDTIVVEGRDTAIAVTLLEVIDPAEPASRAPDAGNRLVAIDVQLENVGDGVYDNYPSNSATIIDVENRQHSGEIERSPTCDSFDGLVTLPPGDVRRGCVYHELPADVALRSWQFNLGSTVGVWEIGDTSSG